VAAPDCTDLLAAFEAALDQPLLAPARPDAIVAFDRAASTIYTACEVRAVDQPGLLHALAVAIAAAGADIHAARVTTAVWTTGSVPSRARKEIPGVKC